MSMIIITGAQGSGLKRLTRILNAHPAIHIEQNRNYPAIVQCITEATAIREKHGDRPWDARAEWLDAPIDKYCSYIALFFKKHFGTKIIGDMDTSYTLQLSRISQIFPNALFVNLIRDGRAICANQLEKFQPPLNHNQRIQACVNHARRWSEMVGSARKDGQRLGNDRYIEVQWKAMSSEPQLEIERILDRIGHRSTPDVNELARQLFPPGQPTPKLSPTEEHAYCAWAPARALLSSLQGSPAPSPGESIAAEPAVALAMAQSAQDDGQLEDAEQWLVNALEHAPHHPGLWHRRALVRQAANDEDGAVAFLTKATAGIGDADPRVDAVHAAIDLLKLSHRSEGVVVARIGRTSTVVQLRQAVARWLVARGLDAEAAEVLARVEHSPWHREM